MQSSCTDVFYRFVYFECNARNCRDCAFREFYLHPFGIQHCRILLEQCVLRLCQDFYEIILGQAFQFYANRETSLHFRDQIAWLSDMECSACNEENMIGPDNSITSTDAG